ncbi:MAG: radical SAM family heme chaperone HemW [Clostridiales bacterium]|nr:radical SAM family heme chaperone HemW [Clostridiales bacterium]
MSGIYVHVPFCKSKCTYCDFASYPEKLAKAESYFACLYREIKGRGMQLKDKVFDTVYIGGGTPSIVDADLIVGTLRQIRNCFNLTKNAEITIEINPGTITEEKVKKYKSVGINRFSIGLQTGFNDQLERLNRIHTAKDFLLCTNLLKGENYSADVLIGLHDQTAEQVQKTLQLAIAGGVSHVSVYALTPEVGTPIYSDYLNGLLPSDDETAELYETAKNYLKENGFEMYEVSNFAKKGYESKHNMNYWERGEYIGVGVSASSFIDGRRFTNSYSVEEYMNAIILNKFPEISSEKIEGEDAEFEFIMLALRTKKGMSVTKFNALFGEDFAKKYAKALQKEAKYIDFDGETLKIKEEYMYVQNSIITEFMN